MQVDTDILPPRVAQIIELLAANARALSAADAIGITIDCAGGNVRVRAHPAASPVLDVRRSVTRRT